MKIPAQQNGNPLAACYCSQLEKALSEVNYAKPLKRQFLSQMQDSLYSYLETTRMLAWKICTPLLAPRRKPQIPSCSTWIPTKSKNS